MIFYIFNNYFFDNSGFSKRCKKEIDILSRKDDIIIFCRKDNMNNSFYKNKYKTMQLCYFDPQVTLLEMPNKYISGIYEIYRNIQLFRALTRVLYNAIKNSKLSKNSITIYAITSPMTLPFLCLLIAKFFRIRRTIIEFHDLEPEMAMHIKKIDKSNIVLKIEYLLEKFLCTYYSRIVVTNAVQKTILMARNHIAKDKIFILPNSIDSRNTEEKQQTSFPMSQFTKNDFIIGYISTLTFDYTFTGMLLLLKKVPQLVKRHPTIKFLVIGDGEGLTAIKDLVKRTRLEKNVILAGKVNGVAEILKDIDVCIIPWEKDMFAETILPTKLFEYLSTKKPVIAPNFGAFKEAIKNNTNGLLYNSYDDLISKIVDLKENRKKRLELGNAGYNLYRKEYDLLNYSSVYTNFLNL